MPQYTDVAFFGAEARMDAEKIRQALVVDEAKIQEQVLARVSTHLSLDSRGRVHIREPTRYGTKDRVMLYLLGARFASDAKLRDAYAVGLAELSESLGMTSASLASRLAELRNEGKVESPGRGEYAVVFARAPWILNEIESSTVKPQ